jgi:hypothetical protein
VVEGRTRKSMARELALPPATPIDRVRRAPGAHGLALALVALALLVLGGVSAASAATGAAAPEELSAAPSPPVPSPPVPSTPVPSTPVPSTPVPSPAVPSPPAGEPQPEASVPAGATPEAGALATNVCSSAFGSFSIGNWPAACWRPYGANSPFNVPIPASPRLASDSAEIIKYMRGHGWSFEHAAYGDFALPAQGSRPVYWSQSTDPIVKVICRGGGFLCQSGMKVRIPKGAKPQSQSDGHMTIVEQSTGLEFDFWQASTPEHGEMMVSAGNSIPIGAGTGTGLGGWAEAADLGLLGGLIRAPELAAGRIEHALVVAVKCVQASDVWPSPTWGGGDSVCPYGGLAPHFANLLQLNMSDAEIAATGAPTWQQAIMKAMAHYGIYVVDTQGRTERQMHLIKEDDLSFTSFGYAGEMSTFMHEVSGTEEIVGVPIRVGKLRVIDPCVPQRTC